MKIDFIEHLALGALFVTLYHWFGITEIVSMASVWTFVLADIILTVATFVILAIITYFDARNKAKQRNDIANLYELWGEDEEEEKD